MTTMLEKMALEIQRKIVGLPKDPDLSDCLDAARAALEAIREPDMEMQIAGIMAPSAVGETRSPTVACFTAMIDVVLNQKTEAPTT